MNSSKKSGQGERLLGLMSEGFDQIGEVRFWRQGESASQSYGLCHERDYLGPEASLYDDGSLSLYRRPREAREISTFTEEGRYRFTKGERSLKSGWLLVLSRVEELLEALNYFYPSALGLHWAQEDGQLRVQHLREKLDRQTGMYQKARSLSDEGCHQLVEGICGPANQCVKKILWQLDHETPLRPSEAANYPGYLAEESRCLPMLCQEACNYFIAQSSKKAREERQQNEGGAS